MGRDTNGDGKPDVPLTYTIQVNILLLLLPMRQCLVKSKSHIQNYR